MFSAALLDHFQHPRNAGSLEGANVRIRVSNPVCGDELHLAALIEANTIRDIRFLCRGCTASIACGSLLTESLKGRELAAVAHIDQKFLTESLGGLPEASSHAAQLGYDALQALLREAANVAR